MIDAGLPLVQCLEILGSQQENKTFGRILQQTRMDVEGGASLADAMRKHPKAFDDLFTNMIAAGEAGGILDTILKRLATYIEKNVKLKAQVKGAIYIASSLPADEMTSTNIKRVTYEIVGPSDASGRVSYLDINGKTIEAGFTSLPWSATVSTTDPGVMANVVAQGDSTALGCRILVNDKLVAENYAEGRDAQAFCLDKAA